MNTRDNSSTPFSDSRYLTEARNYALKVVYDNYDREEFFRVEVLSTPGEESPFLVFYRDTRDDDDYSSWKLITIRRITPEVGPQQRPSQYVEGLQHSIRTLEGTLSLAALAPLRDQINAEMEKLKDWCRWLDIADRLLYYVVLNSGKLPTTLDAG